VPPLPGRLLGCRRSAIIQPRQRHSPQQVAVGLVIGSGFVVSWWGGVSGVGVIRGGVGRWLVGPGSNGGTTTEHPEGSGQAWGVAGSVAGVAALGVSLWQLHHTEYRP
jgi:hypothetical protein